MKELTENIDFEIRFNEVDSMGVVWHGAYPLYLEDAREAFGRKYGLDYLTIFGNGCFAPIVEMNFKYKKPLLYGMHPSVAIRYVPTDAAKILFDYTIYDTANNTVVATGRSVQVFTDTRHQLLWFNPPFYEEWKRKWLER